MYYEAVLKVEVPYPGWADVCYLLERGAHRFDSAVPGSGIGLPIARSLAEAHGGSLHQGASSKLGGACFELEMPAVAQQAKTAMQDEPAPA